MNRLELVPSGEKLGKLVRDLSLGAMLLAELLVWLVNLRERLARRALRWDRADETLCCEMERSSGCEEEEAAAAAAVSAAVAAMAHALCFEDGKVVLRSLRFRGFIVIICKGLMSPISVFLQGYSQAR